MQASADGQRRSQLVDKAVSAVDHWLERFDVVIVGPGLGRDELVHETVIQARALLFSLEHKSNSAFLQASIAALPSP